jgi:serine/threonine protein kinase
VTGVAQLASGVQHIHEVAGLMHRNLKSPNLLLNRNGQLKISQLGLSCLGEEGQTGQKMEIGTLRWMAPEVRREDWAGDLITRSPSLCFDARRSSLPVTFMESSCV